MREGGNADHVVLSPGGLAFVLETKTLAGSVALERGTLTCRFIDDPDEVRRYDKLAPQMTRTVEMVTRLWHQKASGRAPKISPIVVIWGVFDPEVQVSGSLTYVRGDALIARLRDCDASPQSRFEGDVREPLVDALKRITRAASAA